MNFFFDVIKKLAERERDYHNSFFFSPPPKKKIHFNFASVHQKYQ